MSRLFGWSLPPGVSQRDIDQAYGQDYDPSPEAERAAQVLDEMHQGVLESGKGEDAIIGIIDELDIERSRLKDLLKATLSFLPVRGPVPACTCGKPDQDGFTYCDYHDGGWDEPTLKEEIENMLKPKEETNVK